MKTVPDLIRSLVAEDKSWTELIDFIKTGKSFTVSVGLLSALAMKPKNVTEAGFELFGPQSSAMLKVMKSQAAEIKTHNGGGISFNHAGAIHHIEAK